MERHERFAAWLKATYKTDSTLLVASEGEFGEKSIRLWRRGEGEPSVEKLAKLCQLGLDASWYLMGVGEMFSNTPRGRAFAKDNKGRLDVRQQPAHDRTSELIAEIQVVLDRFR